MKKSKSLKSYRNYKNLRLDDETLELFEMIKMSLRSVVSEKTEKTIFSSEVLTFLIKFYAKSCNGNFRRSDLLSLYKDVLAYKQEN